MSVLLGAVVCAHEQPTSLDVFLRSLLYGLVAGDVWRIAICMSVVGKLWFDGTPRPTRHGNAAWSAHTAAPAPSHKGDSRRTAPTSRPRLVVKGDTVATETLVTGQSMPVGKHAMVALLPAAPHVWVFPAEHVALEPLASSRWTAESPARL